MSRKRAWHGLALNPPREERDDEDDDEEAGAAADVVIAGAEAVAAATNKHYNEKDEKKINGRTGWLIFEQSGVGREIEGCAVGGCRDKINLRSSMREGGASSPLFHNW